MLTDLRCDSIQSISTRREIAFGAERAEGEFLESYEELKREIDGLRERVSRLCAAVHRISARR